MTPKQRKVLMSSEKHDWRTPKWLFDKLDAIFHFKLDAAASKENALCKKYIDAETDALKVPWGVGPVWVNPPYGRSIGCWINKMCSEYEYGDYDDIPTIVALLPARPGTQWFVQAAQSQASIIFLPGRLTFAGAVSPAPFPSALFIWECWDDSIPKVLDLFVDAPKVLGYTPDKWKGKKP